MTLTTTLHTFRFDTRKPDEKAAWEQFKADRAGTPIFGPVITDLFSAYQALNGQTVHLETSHIFDNQWNAADVGLRLFDYGLESECRMSGVRTPWLKQGHWLEQTAEMIALRANTVRCGYCGFLGPREGAPTFCKACLASEHLDVDTLHLLRLLPVSAPQDRPPLTEAESAELLPLYREAQRAGITERDKMRIANARARIEEKFEKATYGALTERDGFLYWLNLGIQTSNLIYYAHVDRFDFGWRAPVSDAVRDEILRHASEFPFSYRIICQDGRTLDG